MGERKRFHDVQPGSHQKVAQVRATGPGKVRVAESQDGAVAVAIPGAGVHLGVRTQLDGTERDGCAGKGIPGEIRSVEHVHLIRRLPAAGNEGQRQ